MVNEMFENFRDRIIHHNIIRKLMPIFENQFIYDTYSCRVGKGTLFGIKRLEYFMRSATHNYTREAYILKLDLSGFFMSIYYLTPFDRFVKETLKMRCYGRYVDDFFMIHEDKSLLLSLIPVISKYLKNT